MPVNFYTLVGKDYTEELEMLFFKSETEQELIVSLLDRCR